MNRQRMAMLMLAGGLVIVLLALMARNRGPKNPQVKEPDFPVTFAKADIAIGQVIADELVELRPMTRTDFTAKFKDIPWDDRAEQQKEFVGGTALIPIKKGQPILIGSFKRPPESVSKKVTPGYVAVTLPAPDKPSLYDLEFLTPEDRVDVFGATSDETGAHATSTLLAARVRLLAVDRTWDKNKRAQEEKAIQADIAKATARMNAAATAGAAQEPARKAAEDEIKAKNEQLHPKFEHPSITVEVTSAQAQLLNLWKANDKASFKVALHRQQDPNEVLFAEENLATPRAVTVAAGEGPGRAGAAVLSMEDVVPLLQRDPKKYSDMLNLQREMASAQREQALREKEAKVRFKQLDTEGRNWDRYGQATAPPPRPITPPPAISLPQPVVVPRSVPEPVVRPQPVAPPKPPAPQPRAAGIEVYRGNQRTVVSSG